MTARASITAVLVIALAPAGAGAATVQVTEQTTAQNPPRQEAALEFLAAAGEANRVRVVRNGTEGDKARYDLSDDGAAITAGPGCSGGGAPGATVSCLVPVSRPSTCSISLPGCTDLGRGVTLSVELGDGDDLFIASELPADDGGAGDFHVEATGGDGTDELHSGPTADRIDPGPGADTVKTRQGSDFANAGPAADGPDSFDLGEGRDTLSYEDRSESVTVALDDLANDGSAGEGDTATDPETVIGSLGPDTLIGDGDDEQLVGNGGGDRLIGNGGNDLLDAGHPFDFDGPLPPPTDDPDLIRGGPGDDNLLASLGDDRADGGPGDDLVFGAPGSDRLSGGKGADDVDGAQGADRLTGGSGPDRLDAGHGTNDPQDGAADRLDCGSNADDRASNVERHDRVKRCERVRPRLA